MRLTEEQAKEFKKITKQLVKWINKHCHPHVVVVVDSCRAELSEGVYAWEHKKIVMDKSVSCISCKANVGAWIYCPHLSTMLSIPGWDETGELNGCSEHQL